MTHFIKMKTFYLRNAFKNEVGNLNRRCLSLKVIVNSMKIKNSSLLPYRNHRKHSKTVEYQETDAVI